MGFFREAADRIGDDDVLSKVDALLDWRRPVSGCCLVDGCGMTGECSRPMPGAWVG